MSKGMSKIEKGVENLMEWFKKSLYLSKALLVTLFLKEGIRIAVSVKVSPLCGPIHFKAARIPESVSG
jgi:hypothetical protein